MDEQKHARILARIKKLKALSTRNSSAEEAARALAYVQTLMAKYHINEQDIGLSSLRTEAATHAPSDAETVPRWMSRLVTLVDDAFGCLGYFSWRNTSSGTAKRQVAFLGFGERPEIAAYTFSVLSRQLQHAAADYLKQLKNDRRLKTRTRRVRADQFRDGWVSGVRSVVQQFAVPSEERQLMRLWIRNQGWNDATLRDVGECSGAATARDRGYQQGQETRLHQAVHGEDASRLGYDRGGL